VAGASTGEHGSRGVQADDLYRQGATLLKHTLASLRDVPDHGVFAAQQGTLEEHLSVVPDPAAREKIRAIVREPHDSPAKLVTEIKEILTGSPSRDLEPFNPATEMDKVPPGSVYGATRYPEAYGIDPSTGKVVLRTAAVNHGDIGGEVLYYIVVVLFLLGAVTQSTENSENSSSSAWSSDE
jgi:hypothetical protein